MPLVVDTWNECACACGSGDNHHRLGLLRRTWLTMSNMYMQAYEYYIEVYARIHLSYFAFMCISTLDWRNVKANEFHVRIYAILVWHAREWVEICFRPSAIDVALYRSIAYMLIDNALHSFVAMRILTRRTQWHFDCDRMALTVAVALLIGYSTRGCLHSFYVYSQYTQTVYIAWLVLVAIVHATHTRTSTRLSANKMQKYTILIEKKAACMLAKNELMILFCCRMGENISRDKLASCGDGYSIRAFTAMHTQTHANTLLAEFVVARKWWRAHINLTKKRLSAWHDPFSGGGGRVGAEGYKMTNDTICVRVVLYGQKHRAGNRKFYLLNLYAKHNRNYIHNYRCVLFWAVSWFVMYVDKHIVVTRSNTAISYFCPLSLLSNARNSAVIPIHNWHMNKWIWALLFSHSHSLRADSASS